MTKRTRANARMGLLMIKSKNYVTNLPYYLTATGGGNSQIIKHLHVLGLCFCVLFSDKSNKNSTIPQNFTNFASQCTLIDEF